MKSEFYLSRFIEAQAKTYTIALAEIRSGKKRSHWIWYIFPQLKGLGLSANADIYGLSGLAEARAYLAEPILGPRLIETTEAMLTQTLEASSVLGELDALKCRSCLSLFTLADPTNDIFTKALERFFGGKLDQRTLELLDAPGRA